MPPAFLTAVAASHRGFPRLAQFCGVHAPVCCRDVQWEGLARTFPRSRFPINKETGPDYPERGFLFPSTPQEGALSKTFRVTAATAATVLRGIRIPWHFAATAATVLRGIRGTLFQ